MAPLPALLKPVRPRLRPVAHRRPVARRFVVLCALAWGGAAQVANADCPMELLGRWGGGSFSLAKQGDLVYIGVGPDVVVLDVADPTAPTEVGRVRLGDRIYQIVPDGARMVVAAGAAGLWVVDIADPTQPAVLGVDADFVAKAVAVDGDRAYAMGDALYVVDLATPHAPTTVGVSAEFFLSFLPGVVASGSTVFVATESDGLNVFDVTDPAAPSLVAQHPVADLTLGLALAGDLLYVASEPDGLTILDVSDRTTPTVIGRSEGGYGFRVHLDGARAFVATGDAQIIDVSDPTQPTVGVEIDPRSEVFGVVGDGDLLYAAALGGGLEVWDVSVAAEPVRVGEFRDAAALPSISVNGGYAFGAAYDERLVVVDVTNSAAPELAGSLSVPASRRQARVDTEGGLAYVGDVSGTLRVIDTTDPANPSVIGALATPVRSWTGVIVSGDRVFVAGRDDPQLAIVDVSDPTAPTVAGVYFGDDAVWSADAQGDLVFLATSHSIEIISVQGDIPELVGVYPHSGCVVRVSGDLLFTRDLSRLDIVDISDPANPQRLNLFSMGGFQSLDVAGRHAALQSEGDADLTLTLVDVSDPASPVVLAQFGWPRTEVCSSPDIRIVDNLVYVSDCDGGLAIVRFGLQSDLDLDGRVDLKDLASLLHNLGSDAGVGRPDGDLDGDGDVDVDDLQRLLTDFGQACS